MEYDGYNFFSKNNAFHIYYMKYKLKFLLIIKIYRNDNIIIRKHNKYQSRYY